MGQCCARCLRTANRCRKSCCRPDARADAARAATESLRELRQARKRRMAACVAVLDSAACEELQARQDEGSIGGLPAARHEALAALRLGGLDRRLGGVAAAERELRACFDAYNSRLDGVLLQAEAQALFHDYFDTALPSLMALAEELALHQAVASLGGTPHSSRRVEPASTQTAQGQRDGDVRSPEMPPRRPPSSTQSLFSLHRQQRVGHLRDRLAAEMQSAKDHAQRIFADNYAEICRQWLMYCDTARDGSVRFSGLRSALMGPGCAGFVELTLQCVGISDEMAVLERAASMEAVQLRQVDFHDTPLGPAPGAGFVSPASKTQLSSLRLHESAYGPVLADSLRQSRVGSPGRHSGSQRPTPLSPPPVLCAAPMCSTHPSPESCGRQEGAEPFGSTSDSGRAIPFCSYTLQTPCGFRQSTDSIRAPTRPVSEDRRQPYGGVTDTPGAGPSMPHLVLVG